jgi:ABC-2 type transport system ATP-binding protein
MIKENQEVAQMKLVDISKKFDKELFSNINYTFEKGYIYSIFGKNGIGKTTLLNIMTGHLQPDTGSVEGNLDDIMFIAENTIPFEFITGAEFLNVTLKFKEFIPDEEKIMKLFSQFDMRDAYDKPIVTYSKGMKYKLLLMLVILTNPQILVLDEPLIEVDILTLENIRPIFEKYKKDHIIIFTTHVPNIAYKLSDRLLYLTPNSIIDVENKFESPNQIEEYIYNLMVEEA